MSSFPLATVALYGAGVTASVSPCVLPLVPGYLGVLADADGRPGRGGRVAIFAASAVATFALLGSLVAAFGSVVHTTVALQRVAGALLLVCAAAALATHFGRLQGTWRVPVAIPASPVPRAVALGVGCGAAWTPCVGPLLGAALTAAGGVGSVSRGAALLAAFGFGVVTPLIAIAILPLPRVPASWRRIGRAANLATPALLAVVGLVLLFGWYGPLVQRLPTGT